MRCRHCNKEIKKENISKEHIIHQAIGGLLESSKIYCKDCNSKFGSSSDSKFTKIFVPITQNINMKTSRGKSSVNYDVIVKNKKGEEYIGRYKGSKLQSIYNKSDRAFIKKIESYECNDFEISQITLDISNENFYNGLIKIAENYAIDNGINISDLIQNNKDTAYCNDRIIPFFPMNIFDEYLDKYKSLNLEDLIHVLIIFNIETSVYVYIELFSTFKFYVLVSESYKGKGIYSNYCQRLIKNDFDEDKVKNMLKINKYKDAFIIAEKYRIKLHKEEENDIEESCERIELEAFNFVRKRAYVIDYLEYIMTKNSSASYNVLLNLNGEKFCEYYECSNVYMCGEQEDEIGNIIKNECINHKNFRINNPVIKNHKTILENYPEALKRELKSSYERYNEYLESSLNKLSKLLNCGDIKVKR